MQLPEYGCHGFDVKENQEISCTKGGTMYGECRSSGSSLQILLHITHLKTVADIYIVSFPGPAQLSVACSTQKREVSFLT